MGLIRWAELNFDFVACVRVRIEQQEIEAASAGLASLDVFHVEIGNAQSKERDVIDDTFLEPLLREGWMRLHRYRN